MNRAVVFAYHDVGVRCLKVLLAHGVDVGLVVTHQDNPAETLWFASVAQTARERGIPVITPDDANDDATFAAVAACRPQWLFSFYFRQMLATRLLALAPRGAWNMHGSLLPRYRGRVPVNWAVLHGETRTGATLHEMQAKPDRGGIVAQQAVPILPDDTAAEVFAKVTVAAEMALDACLPDLLAGRAVAREQDQRQASYFGGRKPEDGRIDWTQPAARIHNLVRAVAPPYPGAFTEAQGARIRVLRTLRQQTPAGATAPGEARPAPDSAGAPGLLIDDGHLLLRGADGGLLRVLAAELDGEPLGPDEFERRFGRSLCFPLTAERGSPS
ncbi:MAG: formyltransferase [Betaproteobacteria bacterium]|nr:formyltransferase [Betaproteobacteria bacterium]